MAEDTAVPMKMFWRGQDVETLSREELIEALRYQSQALVDAHKMHQHTLDIWSAYREARR